MELCNVATEENLEPSDQLSCSSCNQLALTLKEKFESTERNALVASLLDTCNSLDSLSEACFNIVANYFDEIYGLAKQYLQSNEICRDIDICASSATEREAALSTAVWNEVTVCTKCKKVVKHMRAAILKGTTEAQFREKLNGLCIKWHVKKAECKLLVDEYYHTLYNLLKSSMNDESICRMLRLCTKNKQLTTPIRLEIKLLDKNHGEELQSGAGQSGDCELCEMVILKMRELIKYHNDSKIALDHVCYLLETKNLESQCRKMLSHHSDSIKKLVLSNKAHQQICRELNMCLLYEAQDAMNVDETLDSLSEKRDQFDVAWRLHALPAGRNTNEDVHQY
ncbi:hypothetical protein AWZ03_002492 [Drosophila navojoa]|uniref:Saposin B-type domain-containing protein n=1 Tax=Drosophila navojoa TaxID=7232 RepID=A0A484BQN7_DRONA|nr:uncharacterized protein LOC108652850 [Drosophila navojoa]TDG51129.1 hypothetical protein AWZ03_002492 [Drosophila navojoa]